MLKLKGKTGAVILDKVFFCERGEHNKVVLQYLEEHSVLMEDDFINNNVVLFEGDLLYTMDYGEVPNKHEKCIEVLLNSDFKEDLEELIEVFNWKSGRL